MADRAFATAGLGREVRFEVADFGTAASLVRNGLGVAFLPESFAASLPADDQGRGRAAELAGLGGDRGQKAAVEGGPGIPERAAGRCAADPDPKLVLAVKADTAAGLLRRR